ncbi:hypothetical protein BGZ51_005224 [Haplosporangium sp. Z 767]|nr:hypothetical protein BGZ51_005224 [Haplosporangium sp. Z 767]KAF9182879.1 hypothetical protein BGZ50_004651 [Haplosporangium sp. Z 11]
MTHFSATVGIPIFCVGFTLDDNLILAGGGGAGRSGVKNKISIYKVDTTNKALTRIVERELNRDEDAPMSISVHPKEKAMALGINSAVNKIKAGENESCRVFQYSSDNIESVHNKGTLASKDPNDYQKVTRFNKDGTLLATGGTDGVIAILKYPSLTPVFPVTQFKGHEIMDLDFSADGAYLSAVSTQNLWIISTETGRVLELITNPVLNKKKPFEFRTCRFGRGAFVNILYTVVNGEKNQKPFVCMWDTSNWTRIRTLAVGPRPITACALSRDGKLIAFGSADMGIRICSSKTLQVLMTIPKAHALPIPSLAFNNDASLLASASVDATCNVISVPKTFPKNNNFVMLVLSLLFLFMAALVQVYQNVQQ